MVRVRVVHPGAGAAELWERGRDPKQWVVCLGCYRAYIVGHHQVDRRGRWLCPYVGCSASALFDCERWLEAAAYPEKPKYGPVYVIRASFVRRG